MSDSKLVTTLLEGFEQARKQRGEITAIAEETGLSPSTITKFLSGATPGITAPNLERLWCALARRGHITPSFTFPVDPILSEKQSA